MNHDAGEPVIPAATGSFLRHYDALMRPGAPTRRERTRLPEILQPWKEPAAAAAAAFVGLVAVGALLVAAAKLQFPSLGAGSGPLRVLSVAVMAGLASLGAGIQIGALAVTVVPLGALGACGAFIASASAVAAGRDADHDPGKSPSGGYGWGTTVAAGSRTGLAFALLCAGAALVFRIPEEPVPVSVSVVRAAFAGLVWGMSFGVAGVLMRARSWRALMRNAWAAVVKPGGVVHATIAFVATSLATLVVGAIAVVVLGLIYRLATSPLPAGFGVGDALAAVVYLLAFLPNVVVCIIALSVGAPILAGAEIDVGNERLGPVVEYSLSSWGNGVTPAPAFLLLLVPFAAFVLAGFVARAAIASRDGSPLVVAMGAVTISVVLGLACLVSEARLGGGLVGAGGVARVAPGATEALLFSLGWSLAAGLAGWGLHDLRQGRKAHVPRDL